MRAWVGVGLLLGTLVTSVPEVAQACGGCFNRPPPTPTAVTTVTYHRMALSVSATNTTLWDQFGYAGRPEEFSWILPIRNGPEVRVQLADVRFLAALDELSAPQITGQPQTPRRNCPSCYTPPPTEIHYCGTNRDTSGPSPSFDAGASLDASSADVQTPNGGVTVLRMEAVGPYEVTTLRGTDSGALRTWLTMNSYAVPSELEPMLEYYIGMRMDFIALRLRDGAGLGQMQPVRVSMPGYQPMLPLRMVSAGIADSVELMLMVLAPTRMESMNFPATVLTNNDIEWDFANPPASPLQAFRRAEREASRAAGNRAWLSESAVPWDAGTLRSQAQSAMIRWRAESDAGSPTEDMDVALRGVGERPYVSRLHSDLPKGMLDRDLMVGPSALGQQQRTYTIGRARNTPTPPVCPTLSCSSGLIAGGEGEIYGPFGERVAPETRFDEVVMRGTLRNYTLQFNGRPRYLDGSTYSQPPTNYIDDCADAGTVRNDAAVMLPDGATRPNDAGATRTDAGRSDARTDGGMEQLRAGGGCNAVPGGVGASSALLALLAGWSGRLLRRRNRKHQQTT